MKKVYDRPLTLREAAEIARKQRIALYRSHSRYLCTASGVCPEQHDVAPYLQKGLCKDNFEATIRWLREHLGDADILLYPTDLNDLLYAFQKELHNKIPTNYWGDEA
jgi:hypothetical protein